MFIDGLDEFEGQEDTVIKMIGDLAEQTYVKICVSSRPLLAFEEAFSEKPRLRLQHLTYGSMIEYGIAKLSEPIEKYVSLNLCERYQAEVLVDKIVERAHGVFLWAIIATRDVYDGLRGMASINELAQTLETLPSEIESLFMLMLHRIKPAFKRDAAYFLHVAMYSYEYQRNVEIDLCRLHFSHSQRDFKDRPAHYEDIANSELIIACRTLEIRLLSHTAGLLELTPKENAQRIYGKRKDHDPILSMKLNFLHRTARDFLLRNDEAKSFLARNGSSEAQVRLSIARGILAQVAHFSKGDAKSADDEWPNPVYYPFLASLEQISKAEQILGAAQANLMQSLDYESWARKYRVSAQLDSESWVHGKDIYSEPSFQPFWIYARHATSIDQVGMAASVGMTRYVCEQLDLPIELRNYPSSFPDLKEYSWNRKTATVLAWGKFNDSENQEIDIATELRSSKYRQALGRYLQYELNDQVNSQTKAPSQNNLLAETYMLCCCQPWDLDLVRVLLRASANPMVQVRSVDRPIENETGFDTASSFWHFWLYYLCNLRYRNLETNGRSQGLKLYDQDIEENITLMDVFDTTKALLENGADINCQLEYLESRDYRTYLKRRDLDLVSFDFSLTASAMFVLEEWFNSEPEFRHFASEIEPLVKRPTRKIVRIELSRRLYTIPSLNYEESEARPSAEESEMLWPLFEKWEDTGHEEDLDAFQAALEEVWRAHHPGVELREGRDPREYESTDCEDDDDDDDDEGVDEYDEDDDSEKGASD